MAAYIYHYTTINSLALILSNNTLRLNSLSNVDDAEEGLADIFGDMSKYVFASSWTRNKFENVALWNMYTPNMRGVRIGIDPQKINLECNESGEVINIKNFDRTICYANSNFLCDVDYKDSSIVGIISNNGEIRQEDICRVGSVKSTLWKFQEEARFMLMGIPRDGFQCPYFLSKKNWFYEMILKKNETSIDYIDLILSDKVWENAEILLGPNSDSSDEIILSSLIDAHYPNSGIKIEKSTLKIRTRK